MKKKSQLSRIHKFNLGDVIIMKNFAGVVSTKNFTLLHKHPYILVDGAKFDKSHHCYFQECKRFYSSVGLYKIGHI